MSYFFYCLKSIQSQWQTDNKCLITASRRPFECRTSHDLQVLQRAEFSTFAGNYNCVLLSVLWRWAPLSNLNILNAIQFLSLGGTGTLKKLQIFLVKIIRPLMNFKRGTDVFTGRHSGFNSNYENKPHKLYHLSFPHFGRTTRSTKVPVSAGQEKH